jgi:ABC transporter DrrB family efflux protein
MFLLVFRYVFGRAIHVSTVGGYADFLIPGVICQSIGFASFGTAVAMAEEVGRGVVDRYRSMPIGRSAVISGRLMADALRMLATIIVMAALGYAVGFRFRTGVGGALGMIILATAFGLAMCCIAAYIGIAVKSQEIVQTVGMLWLGPLMFVSTAFVPAASMPGWLPAFAGNQPVSEVADTMRALAFGGPTATHLIPALAWLAGIMIVFGSLAIRAYRRLS